MHHNQAGADRSEHKSLVLEAQHELLLDRKLCFIFRRRVLLMANLRGPDRNTRFVTEREKDKEGDDSRKDGRCQHHIEDLTPETRFLMLIKFLVFLVGVNEDHGQQEAEKNPKHIHLRSDHSRHGALLLREPVCRDERRSIVEERLTDSHENLPDQQRVKVLVYEAADPEADRRENDTKDGAHAQAVLVHDVDAREVDWEVQGEEGVGHEADDHGRAAVEL